MKSEYFIFKAPPDDFMPSVAAAGCYCEWEDKVLFLKRHQEKVQGNTWGIPGGKLEAGESPRDAVIREVQEEVGLEIATNQLQELGKLFIRLPHVDYVFHLFRFPFQNKPLLNIALDEHTEGRWLTCEEAEQLELIPGGLDALNFYRQAMNK